MAKKRTAEPTESAAVESGESIAGYFRKIFAEQPRLLRVRSNKKLLDRWMADHPGHAEVPPSVKSSLANLKSVLRSKKRKRKARKAAAAEGNGAPAQPAPVARKAVGHNKLEELEAQIDDCLTMARQFDREGLHEIIGFLRRARNAVVWKLG